MNKALFLDLDETVITTNSGRTFPLHTNDWRILPQILPFIKKHVKEGYIVILVTNQAGIELGYVEERKFAIKINNICNKIEKILKLKTRVNFYYCKHSESYHRKPNAGMAYEAALEYELSLKDSIMVGDMETDKQFAYNAGIRTYYDIKDIV